MPGIAGIFGRPRQGDAAVLLDTMITWLGRNRSDRCGSYTSSELEVAIGGTSVENGAQSCVPTWNQERTVLICLAGNHYPQHPTLSAKDWRSGKLACLGHRIIDSYQDSGIDCLTQLNGWFSGVLLDLPRKRAMLFIDRFGFERIYYCERSECLWFSSEAKALLKVIPESRCLDETGLGEYLACGCVLENRTLFKGLRLLPPGAVWTFEAGRPIAKDKYFDQKAWESQEPLSELEYYDALRSTLGRIVPRYLKGPAPVGVSVTGGVDSRMVLGWSGAEPGGLPCYTFGGMYRESCDVRLGRQVAHACHQTHTVIAPDQTIFTGFAELARKTVWLSDGAMDVSGAVELFVNERAARIAPVRLSGNYGGEILRDLVAFRPQTISSSLYSAEVVRLAEAARATYSKHLNGNPLSFVAFKQVPWHHHARLRVEQSQVEMRSPFLDNELVALAFRAPASSKTAKFALLLAAEGNPALGRISTDRGIRNTGFAMWNTLAGLYQECTFKAEYVYDYGMPVWLSKLDRGLRSFRPERLFLGRHKFYHFRIWYRDQLAGYVKDILLDPLTRNRSCFQGKALENLVSDHTKGVRNFTTEITQALSLELVMRELIDG
jgi:asparagine synthase (glutamine-hydrolysing)